ncbi:hypothetical protein Tsubulata_047778 [Turnera subulata]|uniref:Pectinesterase n=1 Tax=Turnera subulata TaxID=218843 RepID=A0A9Q0J046_9ROSI|nr:hypothetical protein Tsubulata_047778 [Turnera subulata]
MAFKLFFSAITLHILLLLPFFSTTSLADTLPSSPVTPGTLCKDTPDPSYCKSVLPNRSANVYDSGRYCVGKSVYQSQRFLNLVNKYLAQRSSLSTTAVRALQDCQFLAGLNIDILQGVSRTVNASSKILPALPAEDVQTYLSAILTNQQTCLEGLQATASSWSVKNGLSVPLSNDTKLYSTSLALFTKGWVPKKKRGATGKLSRRLLALTEGGFLESTNRREILQTDTSQVNLTVSLDGSGDFTSITDAVNASPNNTDGSNGYFVIYVKAGVYEEYVSIAKNKKYLKIVGDGINQTVITGNRSVVDGWTTFNSATFAVVAPNFVGINLTIRNTAGAIKHQAVALRNGADLSVFYNCSFEGYQDTLYTHSMRQFYRECDVYGTVDFIFGNAAVVLQNCNLYPRLPMSGQFNAVTAQGRTDPNQNTGTSIHNCTITAAPDLAASNATVNTYLGRPWKEYSRTVVMQSFLDSLINPAGWSVWSGDFALNTSYYAEYDNQGPGSDTTNRVTWPGYHIINATDAANFTVSGFLFGDNWIPQTGVPFLSGLI